MGPMPLHRLVLSCLLATTSVVTAGDSLSERASTLRSRGPIAVTETIEVTATEGGLSMTSDPVEVHVERTIDGRGRIDLRGWTVFIDETSLAIVHASNDGAWVRVAHGGRPVAALRTLFVDLPSLWVSVAFGPLEGDPLLSGWLRPLPGLRAEHAEGSDWLVLAEGAEGRLQTSLPGAAEVVLRSGPWVPVDGRLTWRSVSRAAEERGVGFDPGRRRRLDSVAALPRRPATETPPE